MKLFSLAAHEKRHIAILIAVLITTISFFHYTALPDDYNLHSIFAELYYIPIFLGVLIFGLRGAVLIYVLILVSYLPYIYMSWTGEFSSEINKFLHIFLQGFLTIFAGFFVDGYKRHREQSEQESYLSGLGQASAAIAHDLKTPLITILGYTKRIREGKRNPDSALQAITESALKMQRIIYDVLDFAKPLKLNLKRENARIVIGRACDSCRAKALQTGVNLSIKETEEAATLIMDSFQIERALINLISNGIEASARGNSIVISLEQTKNSLILKIKDEGTGIDRETLKNIFTPFYSRKSGGTGLGMAIAKKIVSDHNGKIFVESEFGIGTEITVELPCHDQSR